MTRILFATLLGLALNAKAQNPAAGATKTVAGTVAETPQDAPPAKPWSHESEASIIQVDGTTQSESYAAKQKTAYKDAPNIYSISGRYLRAKSAGAESARAWDSFFRYERELSERWSAYLQYGAESDVYAGYVQRDSGDVGGKYFVIKSDPENLFAEAGYRATRTRTTVFTSKTESFGRLYLEWSKKASPTVSSRIWLEYLPNFTNRLAYLANGEAALQVMLSSVFSLKLSYLVKYQNEPAAPAERTDRTFTTSLVAKF